MNAVNKLFDFMDITSGGTYQIQIGFITFPQLQLNAGTNRSAILQELRKSQGNLYDPQKSMSINIVEISRAETAVTGTATKINGTMKNYRWYRYNPIRLWFIKECIKWNFL